MHQLVVYGIIIKNFITIYEIIMIKFYQVKIKFYQVKMKFYQVKIKFLKVKNINVDIVINHMIYYNHDGFMNKNVKKKSMKIIINLKLKLIN